MTEENMTDEHHHPQSGEEVQEEIITDDKMGIIDSHGHHHQGDDPNQHGDMDHHGQRLAGSSEMIRVQRAASVNNRAWQTLIPSTKRPYPGHHDQDMQDDEIEEEMDPHYVQHQQQQYRRAPEGPRKRGRPRKFPAGVPPPDYLARIQAKALDSQVHDLEYDDVDEPPPSLHVNQPQQQQVSVASSIPTGARVVSMGSRAQMMGGRGGTTMTGAAPRLSQPGMLRLPAPVGQAAQIAAQRLPSIGGAPPKENKPLKVVTLLPNSRRVGGGPARPVISGIRTLGQSAQNRRPIPPMAMEKQAEQIINQSVKLGDRLLTGQTIGEFNRIVEQLNNQITSLQDDNRKVYNMLTGLLEYKDNRIKQLETQVERMHNEMTANIKTWQSQLLLQEENLQEKEQREQEEAEEHEERQAMEDHQEQERVVQVQHQQLRTRQRMQQHQQVVEEPETQRRGFIIEERIMRQGENGEMTEEIIEQEVDEETFMRMQQEMSDNGQGAMIVEEVHGGHEEEVVDGSGGMDAAEHQLD